MVLAVHPRKRATLVAYSITRHRVTIIQAMKNKSIVVLVALLLLSNNLMAADYVKATDLQKVNLGDVFDQVAEKIGQPQQVLSKSLDHQGKEQVVWLYEAIRTNGC